MKALRVFLFFCLIGFQSCRLTRIDIDPKKAYDLKELRTDLQVLQGILEKHHPGLHWYQSHSDWTNTVAHAHASLKQGMTEPEFRKIVRPLVASIRCGHTSIRPSKQWEKLQDTARLQGLFPISIKCWSDTLIVLGNLDPKDSLLVRGAQVLSINGRQPKDIFDGLFPYISGDGFNETHKYQTLSGWGTFGNYYRQYLDTASILQIDLLDTLGNFHTVTRSLFYPKPDTVKKAPAQQLTKREKKIRRIEGVRNLQIDIDQRQALMRINSFGNGGRLRRFFRKGFDLMEAHHVQDLIIDVRNNGGGRVGNSTALTRYLTDRSFKIADTLYAIRRGSRYGKYIVHNEAIQASMPFFTKKRSDGFYHFGYFERHRFQPKRSNRYTGRTYILTGGSSFSATTLFVQAVKGQSNVTVIGEETGGGAYGNSAWEIPEAILPYTKIRLRFPLFRMVMNKNLPNNGRGIMPDVEVRSTVESVRRNYDNKMQRTLSLIRAARRKGS